MKKRLFILPTLGAAVLIILGLIAGLGNGSIGSANALPSSPASRQAGTAPTAPVQPFEESVSDTTVEYVGWNSAKEAVFAALGVKESELYDIDYDFERGRYEIDFDYNGREYEYEVDAITGEIVKSRAEPDEDYIYVPEPAPVVSEPPAESVPDTAVEYVGLEKAKEAVFAALGVKESELYDIDYDFERGRYEIDFDYKGYGYEYEVDALTGEIVRAEKEIDD